MAHHQRRQRPLLDVGDRRGHAHVLFGEGLAARETRTSGSTETNWSKRSGARARTSAKLRSVQSPASVSIRRSSSRGASPRRSADDVGRFARPQQRAAPQRHEAVRHGPLGQLPRLAAADVVERDGLLALEAALEVVGGLAVAGEVHLRSGSPAHRGLSIMGACPPTTPPSRRVAEGRAVLGHAPAHHLLAQPHPLAVEDLPLLLQVLLLRHPRGAPLQPRGGARDARRRRPGAGSRSCSCSPASCPRSTPPCASGWAPTATRTSPATSCGPASGRSNGGCCPTPTSACSTREDLARLREVSASQGLMLESISERLMETVHAGSPTKHPGAAAGDDPGRGRAEDPLHERDPGRHRREPARSGWPRCRRSPRCTPSTATCRR